MKSQDSRSYLPILCFCLISTLFLLLEFYNVLKGIGKPYVKSLDSWPRLPSDPPPPPLPRKGQTGGHKIADFVFCLICPLECFAFTALECINR